MTGDVPFWKTKTLTDMSRDEWESLCDGCGRCCLNKLEDEDTGKFLYTRAACKLLDVKTCRCTDYPNRAARVPDCVTLTPENVGELGWLPQTCAYRLLDGQRTVAELIEDLGAPKFEICKALVDLLDRGRILTVGR